MQKSSKHTTI